MHVLPLGGVTIIYLRSYITGSSDAILNEVDQTTAVPPVGAYHGQVGVLKQLRDTSSWSHWAI
jgi:hypothetical protein